MLNASSSLCLKAARNSTNGRRFDINPKTEDGVSTTVLWLRAVKQPEEQLSLQAKKKNEMRPLTLHRGMRASNQRWDVLYCNRKHAQYKKKDLTHTKETQ